MKREKIGKQHLFKTKSRTPFSGITFIALQENDQEEIPASEYIKYILIGSSVESLCSKSSWLSNYIAKLLTDKNGGDYAKFTKEDNIFGITKFLSIKESKELLKNCSKILLIEIFKKNHITRNNLFSY